MPLVVSELKYQQISLRRFRSGLSTKRIKPFVGSFTCLHVFIRILGRLAVFSDGSGLWIDPKLLSPFHRRLKFHDCLCSETEGKSSNVGFNRLNRLLLFGGQNGRNHTKPAITGTSEVPLRGLVSTALFVGRTFNCFFLLTWAVAPFLSGDSTCARLPSGTVTATASSWFLFSVESFCSADWEVVNQPLRTRGNGMVWGRCFFGATHGEIMMEFFSLSWIMHPGNESSGGAALKVHNPYLNFGGWTSSMTLHLFFSNMVRKVSGNQSDGTPLAAHRFRSKVSSVSCLTPSSPSDDLPLRRITKPTLALLAIFLLPEDKQKDCRVCK